MKHPVFRIFEKVQKDVKNGEKIKNIRKKHNISRYVFNTFYRDPGNGEHIKDLEESRANKSGPPELWDKLKAKDSLDEDKISKKEQCLVLLEKSLGNVSQACKGVGIARSRFYVWLKDDPEFKQRYEEQEEAKLDFAESKLSSEMNDGNITAIIFYLKTKGRGRGYIEKKDINMDGNIIIKTDEDDDQL